MADVRPTIKEQLTLAARCEKCSGYAFLLPAAYLTPLSATVPRSEPTSAWTADTRCSGWRRGRKLARKLNADAV